MKEVGWGEMDTCLICGVYVPEGRQVCPYCERRESNINRQITKKRPKQVQQRQKLKYRTMPLRATHCQ